MSVPTSQNKMTTDIDDAAITGDGGALLTQNTRNLAAQFGDTEVESGAWPAKYAEAAKGDFVVADSRGNFPSQARVVHRGFFYANRGNMPLLECTSGGLYWVEASVIAHKATGGLYAGKFAFAIANYNIVAVADGYNPDMPVSGSLTQDNANADFRITWIMNNGKLYLTDMLLDYFYDSASGSSSQWNYPDEISVRLDVHAVIGGGGSSS